MDVLKKLSKKRTVDAIDERQGDRHAKQFHGTHHTFPIV